MSRMEQTRNSDEVGFIFKDSKGWNNIITSLLQGKSRKFVLQ